jgi:hypothetical protein
MDGETKGGFPEIPDAVWWVQLYKPRAMALDKILNNWF